MIDDYQLYGSNSSYDNRYNYVYKSCVILHTIFY